MAKLIGLFGGTFDPIHYGHLLPALEVMQAASLDEVRFIPNCVPPHRGEPLLSDLQRAELVQLAILDTPGFVLDQRELKRDGPSYMVDTLLSLQRDFPDSSLCLIMGMDAFNKLPQWHRWQTLFELCNLIVTSRPGSQLPDFADQTDMSQKISDDPKCLRQRPVGQILLQSVTQLDISASLIRQHLSNRQSIQFLLPEAVREKLEQAYVR